MTQPSTAAREGPRIPRWSSISPRHRQKASHCRRPGTQKARHPVTLKRDREQTDALETVRPAAVECLSPLQPLARGQQIAIMQKVTTGGPSGHAIGSQTGLSGFLTVLSSVVVTPRPSPRPQPRAMCWPEARPRPAFGRCRSSRGPQAGTELWGHTGKDAIKCHCRARHGDRHPKGSGLLRLIPHRMTRTQERQPQSSVSPCGTGKQD